MAKLELHVVDENDTPVANANVSVIMGMISTAYRINGQTDTNGVFIIKGKTKGVNLKTIVAISYGFDISVSEFLNSDYFKYENLNID